GYFQGWTEFAWGVTSASVVSIPDGRLQIFASDHFGRVWFRTQSSANSWQHSQWKLNLGIPGGQSVNRVEARSESGKIIVRAYTSSLRTPLSIWEIERSATGSSEIWPTPWTRLKSSLPNIQLK